MAQGCRAGEGADTIEHLEVVGTDSEGGVSIGREGRSQLEKGRVGDLRCLSLAQHLSGWTAAIGL